MANTVFELLAKIGIDTSDFVKGLGDAKSTAEKVGSGLKTGFSTIAKGTAVAVGAVSTAITASSAALVKSTQEVAAYGDTIDKQSQKIGISAQAYQEWDAILQHSGADISVLTTSMKTLVNAASTNSDAFQKLGISQKEALSMGQEELFSTVITKLQDMEDETERTYIASKILGRGAMELGPLLNSSSEDLEKMRQELHDTNAVMSDEAVKASAAYQDTLQDMTAAFTGVKNSLIGEFLTPVTQVMQGITTIMKGSDEGIDQVVDGITAIADTAGNLIEKVSEKVSTLLPKLMDKIPGAISKLMPIFSKALQDGIPVIIDTVMGIATAIVSALPEILSSIIDGIMKSEGTIVKAVGDIISAVFDGIKELFTGENVSKILTAVLGLIQDVAKMIGSNIPGLVEAVTAIILAITDAFSSPENISMLAETAAVIVTALVEGLTSGDTIQKLFEAVLLVQTAAMKALSDPEVLETVSGAIGTIIAELVKAIAVLTPEILMSLGTVATTMLETFASYDWAAMGTAIIDGISKSLGEFDWSFFEESGEKWNDFWEGIGERAFDALNELFSNLKSYNNKIGFNVDEVIDYIVNRFKDFVSKIKTKVTEIKTNISTTLTNIVTSVTAKSNAIKQTIVDRINSAVQVIKDLPTKATTWGRDMIQNFVNGITSMISTVSTAASEIASTIASYIHFSEPDIGPLSDFSTYAPDMIDTFVKGIEDNKDKLSLAMNDMLDVSPEWDMSVTANTSRRESPDRVNSGAIVMILQSILLELQKGHQVVLSTDMINRALGQTQADTAREEIA